ncbi:MAG: shikimate kinase [Ruminococcaceae bacterium]|nr:shikimate kinase [Oscillospiraceae bacterium]
MSLQNVILIGMPSCGKSTVGVLLAKHLGFRFLDTDLLIQEHTGKLLHEIIADEGNEAFLTLENRTLSALNVQNTVISTGGSAVYGKEAMAHLREIGTVIYLQISYETMAARLGDYTHRGVVLPAGWTLHDLYEERAVLYERYAHHIINEEVCAGGLGDTLEHTLALCKRFL